MPAIVMSHRPIDVMVICLGTNDQKTRFGLKAQDVALGVTRLAREAMVLGVVDQILIIAPPPLRECGDFAEMFAGAEVRGAGLSGHMARFAKAGGYGFLDAGEVIAVDPIDGIHWAAETHAKFGAAVADRLRGM
ncbi:GDSL family lipase, partial [bacterium]|nr:GDSL family lipase [bacterium]